MFRLKIFSRFQLHKRLNKIRTFSQLQHASIETAPPLTAAFESAITAKTFPNAWASFSSIALTDQIFNLDQKTHFLPLLNLTLTSTNLNDKTRLERANSIISTIKDTGSTPSKDCLAVWLKIVAFTTRSEEDFENAKSSLCEFGDVILDSDAHITANLIFQVTNNANIDTILNLFDTLTIKSTEAYFCLIKAACFGAIHHETDGQKCRELVGRYWDELRGLHDGSVGVDPRLYEMVLKVFLKDEEGCSADVLKEWIDDSSIPIDYISACFDLIVPRLLELNHNDQVIELWDSLQSVEGFQTLPCTLHQIGTHFLSLTDEDQKYYQTFSSILSTISTQPHLSSPTNPSTESGAITIASKTLSDCFDIMVNKACEKFDLKTVESMTFNIKRAGLWLTSKNALSIIKMYVELDQVDEGLAVYQNYKHQFLERISHLDPKTGQNMALDVPIEVFNVILVGLGSDYRMAEFQEIFDEVIEKNLFTNETLLIALETYVQVTDVKRAISMCDMLYESSQPNPSSTKAKGATEHRVNRKTNTTMVPYHEESKVPFDLLVKLFDCCSISVHYPFSAKVLGWIRDSAVGKAPEFREKVREVLRTKVQPMSQLIEKDLVKIVNDIVHQEETLSISDKRDLEFRKTLASKFNTSGEKKKVLQESEEYTKSLINKQFHLSMGLFDELVGLKTPLPYSLFQAAIRAHHFKNRDMVGVAKVWGLVIEQSRNFYAKESGVVKNSPTTTTTTTTTTTPSSDNNSSIMKKRQQQMKPSPEIATAFLHAARDLCGKQTARSVIKFIYSESLDLNYDGYYNLIGISCKYGWLDEIISSFEAMESKQIKIHSTLYGYTAEILRVSRHFDVALVFEKYMERRFPEVIGAWLDSVDREWEDQVGRSNPYYHEEKQFKTQRSRENSAAASAASIEKNSAKEDTIRY